MPVGTRLGLLYSWKSKMIINTKNQFLGLFKREQTYNYNYKYVIIDVARLKNNRLLRGEYYAIL